ncbi:MAG TPA: PVC-type heme-binding CxxCH protein, partial [Candidatus Saccharimonadales bacterium]|nr:PVC-type heme-binding CxxCH protein [Candidatus Saccharimonadales bacterium]
DRISWLEDTNGDGIMDKKHVFYEGLELVTSLVFYKDGVIVAQAPDILWLRDTDGDGKADKVETLFTGFGTGDTHAVINNLRWGMDGWIYGAVGYSGGHPKSGDGKLDFGNIGSAIYRFKPDASAFEVLASTACNTWGFDFGWDNEMYYSTPTCGDHALHIALPERILARGNVGNIRAQNAMQDHTRVKPLVHHTRPAYVQIDVVGGFTAAAGSCLYVGGAWPEKYNNTYFVSEPTVSLVHEDFLSPKGATFVASKEPGREENEFIAGTDLWFRPIHTRVGPDGAMYVIDFYNQAVIHNDTRGPKHGANNAATRPDRDHHFARIWRVQHNEAKKLPKADFKNNAGILKALEHPNGWARMTAQRLLFEKNDTSTVPALAKLLRNASSPATRVHALWALNDMGKLDDTLLLASLKDKDSAVQKNALRVISESENNSGAAKLNAIQTQLNSSNDRVRLQALVALQSFEANDSIARSVVKAWPSLGDKYLESAAIGVAAKDPVIFLQAALNENAGAAHEAFVRHVVRVLAQKGDPAQIAKLLNALGAAAGSADGQKQIALASLNQNLKQSASLEWNAELERALKSLLNGANPAVAGATLPLVVRWDKGGALSATLRPIISQLGTKLSDPGLSEEERGQVAANLIGVRQIAPEMVGQVVKLLAPGNSPALQMRVIEVLGGAPDSAVGTALVDAFPNLAPELRESAFAQIVKRQEWAQGLVQAIADKKVDLATLGPSAVHRLRTHPDPSVARKADEAISAIRGPEQQQKDKLIADLLPVVEQSGNLENGRKMFTQNCLVCHTHKGQGRNLAPDLTGMGVHGPHELLVHIIDPNRVVEPNYVAINIETKDDNSYDGILASENRTSVKLRNATGDIEIPKDNIRSRKSTGRSLMPEGFEALGGEVLRDIIGYVASDNARFRIVDLTKVFNVDSTRGIYVSKETTRDSVHFSRFGVVAAGQVPFDIVSPAKSSTGNNLLVLKGGDGIARGYQQKAEVPVSNLQISKLHLLGGIGGWAWPFGGEENKGLPAAKLSVLHANGESESFTLSNGVHVVDYNNGSAECPGSRRVEGVVRDGQIRTMTFNIKGTAPVTKITLESFNNTVAPTFAAITAEVPETTAVANK